jgi:Mlc titration factor MtfA (ptsG expression regulator)
MSGWLKQRRREQIKSQDFPEAWESILRRSFPRYLRMSPQDQVELRGDMLVFLSEKHFEGAGGIEITDEIRVTIAAQACFLLLHRETDFYPGLHSIIVYPHEYAARPRARDESGLVKEGFQVRLGETAAKGAVVLAWDAAARGASDMADCQNVVFHEFAHQLDAEEGSFNGAPLLPRRSMYLSWARILGEEYQALRERVATHQPTDINPYGATNPAEFFAVATECFFQQPANMKKRHPALYEELKLFYQQDPEETSAD